MVASVVVEDAIGVIWELDGSEIWGGQRGEGMV